MGIGSISSVCEEGGGALAEHEGCRTFSNGLWEERWGQVELAPERIGVKVSYPRFDGHLKRGHNPRGGCGMRPRRHFTREFEWKSDADPN